MIWEGIKELFRSAVRMVKKVIRGILNFFKEVVQYFKNLLLNPEKDTPFILDAGKLGEQIKNAPKVDCGIFEGVYHEDTNTITDYQTVEADSLDDTTKETLKKGEDGIVALT